MEAILWLILGVVVLAMRFMNLSWVPLSNPEANTALTSLNVSNGIEITAGNPFAIWVQALIFNLFGASDFSTRIVACVSGVLICLAPVLLRSRISPLRAFIFSAILVISPTMWFVSRQASGVVLAWLCSILALVFYFRKSNTTALICLGLLLACGQDAVLPIIVTIGWYSIAWIRAHSSLRIGPRMAQNILVILVAFILAATGLMLRPVGIGEALNGLITGLSWLGESGPLGYWRLFIGLTLYEPLLLLLAILGVALLIVNKRWQNIDLVWLLWVGLGAILSVVDKSRSAVDLVPLLIGSAGLASHAGETYIQTLRSHEAPAGKVDLAVAAVAICMLIYSYHGAIMYAGQRQLFWLVSVLLGLLVVTAVGIIATITLHPITALRGIGGAIILCLFLLTFSNGFRLTQLQNTSAAEAYTPEVASSGLRDLMKAVQQESIRIHGDPDTLAMQVSSSAPPALRWVLRTMPNIKYADSPGKTGALLTPASYRPQSDTPLIGSSFQIITSAPLGYLRCSPAGMTADQLDCAPLVKWLAFRSVSERSSAHWVFWINDVQSGNSGNDTTDFDKQMKRD